MKKTIKLVSLLFILLNLVACDNSDDNDANENVVMAKYTFVQEGTSATIPFINTSENADSYLWDFGDTTTSTAQNPIKTFTQTGQYQVKLTARNNATGATSVYTSQVSVFVFAGGLVSNGNFESGTSPWTLGVTNPIPATLLVSQAGNTYFSINVAAAGNPFDVNLSQVGKNMTQGKTYRLTFDAWSNVNRSMIVGIGLSGAPFTNATVTRNLTTAVQNFSIDLVANFTSANSRVLFDMGAATGTVNIDNVTLVELP
ncbi:carbohydrate binding domain-containing protein [Flavobacterium sp.]|uniref:carbohydrate binding domain-containing protein n=1 Tax=Flavobacterium sp. TaxID=239 RepID=UPI002629CE91|nr:carbohydrate binding domain-containing protein [Flavobacterium sp.]